MNLLRIFSKSEHIDKVAQLEKENAELKSEIEKRQLAINKTNAYWKKVVRDMKQQMSRRGSKA